MLDMSGCTSADAKHRIAVVPMPQRTILPSMLFQAPWVCDLPLRPDLDFGSAPAPCECVQQRNTAEKHVLSLVTASKGGQVAIIRQSYSTMAIAGTGSFTLHL